jgi:hypothetical protein
MWRTSDRRARKSEVESSDLLIDYGKRITALLEDSSTSRKEEDFITIVAAGER